MNLPDLSIPVHDLDLFTGQVDTANGLLLYLHPNGQGGFKYHTLRPSVGNAAPTTTIIPIGTVNNATDPGNAGEAKQDANYLYLHNGATWSRLAKPSWDIQLYAGDLTNEAAMIASTGLPGRYGYRKDLQQYVIQTSGDGSISTHWRVLREDPPRMGHLGLDAPSGSDPSLIHPQARNNDVFQALNSITGTVSTYNPVLNVWHRQITVTTAVPALAGSTATPYVTVTLPSGFNGSHHIGSTMERVSGDAECGITVVDVANSNELRVHIAGIVQAGGLFQIKTILSR